jgi:hypothetical protein
MKQKIIMSNTAFSDTNRKNKMQIKSLEQMETIVKSNKALMWDGWTVVNSYPSEKGRTAPQGAFVDGKWHLQRRFVPSKSGWDIPDKFVS